MRRQPQKARVLLVEDDELIRLSLEAALDDEGYQVQAEADGHGAERGANAFRPDLVILDVQLGAGPDGFVVARRLRAGSDVPILFLTAADAVADRVAGFDAGGDDYLVKPFEMTELLARVHSLLRRAGRLRSAVRQVGDLVLDEASRTVIFRGEPVELTPTEYQLLQVLVEHPGQVLSRTQLVSRVWGFDPGASNLLNVHMSALRRKLEAHGHRMIHTVRSLGYVLRT